MPLIKRDEVALIEVAVAGVGYDAVALRQIQVMECSSVAKAHERTPILGGKFIAIALLGQTLVCAELKLAALVVEQGSADRCEMCLTA